jgi:hypothetical protein
VLEAVLPPLITAYGIFVAMVLSARHGAVPRPRGHGVWLGPHRRGIVRHLATTAIGGYVVFVAIVAIFHSWLGEEADALASAVVEGSLLMVAVFAAFVASAAIRGSPEE